MKVYIYCTKAKPELFKTRNYITDKIFYYVKPEWKFGGEILNGKIVASFDLNNVEEMGLDTNKGLEFINNFNKESQLTLEEIANYVGDNYYYAWHIENLKILDEPLELRNFRHPFVHCKNYCDDNFIKSFCRNICSHNQDSERLNVYCDRNDKYNTAITKAPQSWCYAKIKDEECILISIKPEWVCKILNGEKTIEIRKNAPKELIR